MRMAVVKAVSFFNKLKRLMLMKHARVFAKIIFWLTLASPTLSAFASNNDWGQGNISYSHISVFAHAGEGVQNADFKGGIVRGSYAFSDRFFVLGDYASQRTNDSIVLGPRSDKVTTEQGHIGLGFHTPVAAKTDFVVSAQYAVAIVELFGETITSEGVLAQVGLRSRVQDRWEFSLGANYTNQLDEGEFGYAVSGRFYATPRVSLGLNFESVFDVEAYGLLLRYEF